MTSYGEVETMANEETNDSRQMLPEVKAYTEATEAARAVFESGEAALNAKYPGRHGFSDDRYEQRRKWTEERDTLSSAYEGARNRAWEALEQSADPLVKWIAQNCADYRTQAGRVLQELPATLEQLDDLAAEQDWCGVWNAFKREAQQAGVLPEDKPLSPAYRAVLDVVNNASCCALDASSVRRVRKALDTLVQQATESAAVAA